MCDEQSGDDEAYYSSRRSFRMNNPNPNARYRKVAVGLSARCAVVKQASKQPEARAILLPQQQS